MAEWWHLCPDVDTFVVDLIIRVVNFSQCSDSSTKYFCNFKLPVILCTWKMKNLCSYVLIFLPNYIDIQTFSKVFETNTVNFAYNELLGTMRNSSFYPEFLINV